MTSKLCIALLIVKILGDISALLVLPQVDKNNILETDISIRDTTNKLFTILRLKVNERTTLKQYSLIHNYLVSTSLQDYSNLIEVAKLTRVDKIKLNNQTKHFMAILNEILNEDINHDTEIEDGNVVEHIEGFLKNLDEYTDSFKYRENNVDYIAAEILKYLENNDTFSEVHIAQNNNLNHGITWSTKSKNTTLHQGNDFWEPSGRRIFSGAKTSIRDFPFMASIQIFNHFQCAGSIVKSDLIITAASCLQLAWNNRFFRENPAFLSARVGSTYHNVGGENIPILEVYFHPGYDPPTLKNNLALLRLYRVLNFAKSKKRLKKIAIDRHANRLPVNTRGITIVGWGARRRSNVVEDPFLSFAVLDFYDLKECQDVYSKQYVTSNHFCAGFISVGGGACNRDIGGPGITHGYLTGIVSFGSPVCGTPDAPTVFTKLGYYSDWIDGIMEQEVVSGKRKTTRLPLPSFTFPTNYHQTAKTTFKIQPPVFTKKSKTTNILREQDISQEAANILRIDKDTKTSKVDSIERIPFTYSPVTTLEPPIIYSTIISDIHDDKILRDNEDGEASEFSSIMGSGEVENLIKDETKVTEASKSESQETNYPENHLIQQIPFTYPPVTMLEPPESLNNLKSVMKADDTSNKLQSTDTSKTDDTIDKSQNADKDADKHIIINISDKLNVEDKDKELTSQLEQDILQILDGMNLEEFLIKERAQTDRPIPFSPKNEEKDIKNIFNILYLSDSEQNNITTLSSESEDSREGGLEIIADVFKNFSLINNITENIDKDSDKVLFDIVTDVLKEEFHNKINRHYFNINRDYDIQPYNNKPQNLQPEKDFFNKISTFVVKAITKSIIEQNNRTPKITSGWKTKNSTKRIF